MKFHTTFKDIVVAIIVLLSCAAVVLWAVAYLDMPNPSDVFAAKIIERLDGEGGLSIEIGSIGRNYLKNLHLSEVRLSYEDQLLGEIETVHVVGGLPNILLALLMPSHAVRIQANGLHLKLTEAQLMDLFTVQTTETPRLLSFGFVLELADADLDVELETGTVTLSKSNLQVDFRTGVEALHIAGTAEKISGDISGFQAAMQHVVFGLDSIDRIVLEAAEMSGQAFDGNATCEQLVVVLEDLSSLALSLHNLHTDHPELRAAIDQLSLHANGDLTSLDTLHLSVASFVGSGNQWSANAPTTSAQLSLTNWDPQTLSIHTHTELPFFLSLAPYGDFSGKALSLQVLRSGDAAFSGMLSVAEASDRTYLSAEDVHLFVEGDLADTLTISTFATADIAVAIPQADLWFTSPLDAEFSYRADAASLTGELLLPQVESSLLHAPFAVGLSVQGSEQDAQVEGSLWLDQEFDLRTVVNIEHEQESSVTLAVRMNSLHAEHFTPIINRWAPFLKPYLQEQTTFNGNLSVNAAIVDETPSGRISADIALIDAQVGNTDLDAGFTFLGQLQDQQIIVPTLSLASSGYRLSFRGETEMNYWLPRGEVNLHRVSDGVLLASASMLDLPPDAYEVTVLTTGEQQVQAEVLVQRIDAALLLGEGNVYYRDDITPLSFSVALDTLDISLSQEEHLDLSLSLTYPQTLALQADRFQMPGSGIFYSGDLTAEFHDLTSWSVAATALLLEELPFEGQTYTLSFPFAATATELAAPDILLHTPTDSYQGTLLYQGTAIPHLPARKFVAPYHLLFTLNDRVEVTLLGSEETMQAVVHIDEFPIGDFGLLGTDALIDLSLVGETNFQDAVSFDAALLFHNADSSLETELSVIDEHLTVSQLRYQRGNLVLEADSFELENGILSLTGTLNHLRFLPYTDQYTHIAISLLTNLGPMRTIFDAKDAIDRARRDGFIATVAVEDLLLFNEGGIADGTYQVSWDGKRGRIDSELFSFSYDPSTGDVSAHADRRFGVGFSLDGSLAEEDFGLILSDIYFSLPMLNRFFVKPVFLFYEGIAEGEIFLGGTRTAPRAYGQLYINSSEMFVWWLPDDIIELRGTSVTIDGDRATTSYFPFFSTNTRTNETVQGYGELSAHFDGLMLEHYEIHIDNLDKPVYVWLPLVGIDVDIRGYGIGTFNLFGIGYQTWLDGELTIFDTTMTMGIKGTPFWFLPTYETSTAFTITTGKGVNFFYPNTPNPFIRATLTENQEFFFSYDHLSDKFEIDGDFAFRSGEFYYFQKNFLITEGQMQLSTDTLSEQLTIKPRINLRAKVSDFDALGNRVDIFLVLRDSTLTNLNPQFESIPSKEVNEIMEILGQSILPSGAYGEIGLYSVASLAAAATDVAERLGYLEVSQTVQLTEAIRLSLGLDMFSLRSNIVQNILFDALPVSGVAVSLSPIARYLDNTSVFMGKYIGTNFFLQALVHLSAMQRSKVTTSFLSPDLSLDLELSLDWENPLATISFFTQPSELSFTNFLDTMGFSVTKRIVLR